MKTTMTAFIAALALALPAGWQATEADDPEEGSDERPRVAELVVGDATVSVSLDRIDVRPGQTVRATVVASSAAPSSIPIVVALYEESGESMGRTMAPPRALESAEATLAAKAGGGAARTFAFTVPEARFEQSGRSMYAYVQVTAKDGAEYDAAMVPIAINIPAAYRLSVAAKGRCAYDVTVENVSKRALRGIYVSDAVGGFEPVGRDEEARIERLGAGAKRTLSFKATACETIESGEHEATFTSWAEVGGAAETTAKLALGEGPALTPETVAVETPMGSSESVDLAALLAAAK